MTTTQPTQVQGGSGSTRAPSRATVSTHLVPTRAGNIAGGPSDGTEPATSPAGNPYSITNPATGTASRFATTLTSGSRPNTSTLGMITPTWAPRVTPSGRPAGRTPQTGRQPRSHRADTGRCTHRQPEPDRPDQQRVDQHQPDHGEREYADRAALTARCVRRCRQPCHHPGPQDRRLEPCERDEPGDHRDRQRPARKRPHPHQQRSARSQNERNVLSRHRSEVRQPAGAEAVDHVSRLVSIVADHQTPVQRTVGFGKYRSGALDRGTHTIRCPRHWSACVDVARPAHDELAHDVLPCDPAGPLGVERATVTTHRDPLATPPRAHPLLLGAARATRVRTVRPRPRR